MSMIKDRLGMVRGLESSLATCRSGEFRATGIEFKSLVIAGILQDFQWTLKQLRYMIWYQLADCVGAVEVAGMSEGRLFALAEEKGMISSAARWLKYFDADYLSFSNDGFQHTVDKVSAFVEFFRKECE